jgi:hypothetical protein
MLSQSAISLNRYNQNLGRSSLHLFQLQALQYAYEEVVLCEARHDFQERWAENHNLRCTRNAFLRDNFTVEGTQL